MRRRPAKAYSRCAFAAQVAAKQPGHYSSIESNGGAANTEILKPPNNAFTGFCVGHARCYSSIQIRRYVAFRCEVPVFKNIESGNKRNQFKPQQDYPRDNCAALIQSPLLRTPVYHSLLPHYSPIADGCWPIMPTHWAALTNHANFSVYGSPVGHFGGYKIFVSSTMLIKRAT